MLILGYSHPLPTRDKIELMWTSNKSTGLRFTTKPTFQKSERWLVWLLSQGTAPKADIPCGVIHLQLYTRMVDKDRWNSRKILHHIKTQKPKNQSTRKPKEPNKAQTNHEKPIPQNTAPCMILMWKCSIEGKWMGWEIWMIQLTVQLFLQQLYPFSSTQTQEC